MSTVQVALRGTVTLRHVLRRARGGAADVLRACRPHPAGVPCRFAGEAERTADGSADAIAVLVRGGPGGLVEISAVSYSAAVAAETGSHECDDRTGDDGHHPRQPEHHRDQG